MDGDTETHAAHEEIGERVEDAVGDYQRRGGASVKVGIVVSGELAHISGHHSGWRADYGAGTMVEAQYAGQASECIRRKRVRATSDGLVPESWLWDCWNRLRRRGDGENWTECYLQVQGVACVLGMLDWTEWNLASRAKSRTVQTAWLIRNDPKAFAFAFAFTSKSSARHVAARAPS